MRKALIAKGESLKIRLVIQLKQVLIQLKCAYCQYSKPKVMETLINTAIESDIKQKILNNQFFSEVCPSCKKPIHFIYPCTYVDKKHRLILCFKEKPEIHDQTCHKRYVENVAQFKEKIRIFDSSLNDHAVEICKRKLKLHCEKQGVVNSISFDGIDAETIWFLVNDEMKGISIQLYKKALNEVFIETLDELYYVNEGQLKKM